MQARLKAQQKAWLEVEQKAQLQAQSTRCGLRQSSRRGPRRSTRNGSSNLLFASACKLPPVGCFDRHRHRRHRCVPREEASGLRLLKLLHACEMEHWNRSSKLNVGSPGIT